jgi:hypothetical protein
MEAPLVSPNGSCVPDWERRARRQALWRLPVKRSVPGAAVRAIRTLKLVQTLVCLSVVPEAPQESRDWQRRGRGFKGQTEPSNNLAWFDCSIHDVHRVLHYG